VTDKKSPAVIAAALGGCARHHTRKRSTLGDADVESGGVALQEFNANVR